MADDASPSAAGRWSTLDIADLRSPDELGVLARRFNEMVDGMRQLLVVKDLFGRFVSPDGAIPVDGGACIA